MITRLLVISALFSSILILDAPIGFDWRNFSLELINELTIFDQETFQMRMKRKNKCFFFLFSSDEMRVFIFLSHIFHSERRYFSGTVNKILIRVLCTFSRPIHFSIIFHNQCEIGKKIK